MCIDGYRCVQQAVYHCLNMSWLKLNYDEFVSFEPAVVVPYVGGIVTLG